ncbi:MAG: hypothetical protein ACRC1H_13425 [Caldilineaceae bacterium]
MLGIGWETIIYDALWFLVIVGWITLIVAGLEADKPLSGGLPGHAHYADAHDETTWNSRDRLAVLASWAVFALAAASLPFILWWIFTIH